jgi:hypothetical protein
VFSRSKDEHLEDLESILIVLKKVGITLSIAKCHFAYLFIKAFGYYVLRLGLSITKEKTAVIRALKYPSDLHELELSIGFFDFYRKFVKSYAHVVRPLKNFKKRLFRRTPIKGQPRRTYAEKTYEKKGTFEINAECKKTWNILKNRFGAVPVLAFPDFDKNFILYTDGSKEINFNIAFY